MIFSLLFAAINCLDFLVEVDPETNLDLHFGEDIIKEYNIGDMKILHVEYDFFPLHLLGNPLIKHIEENQSVVISNMLFNDQTNVKSFMETVEINEINENKAYFLQKDPIWSLDAIDQTSKSLDKRYFYRTSSGKGVNVYIIDTGVDITHPEFEKRAVWGFNSVDKVDNDCNGHGTHVAGTVGSVNYGVAKKSKIIAVKVLGCEGGGNYSTVIAGIEFVLKRYKSEPVPTPSVVNMSLGGPKSEILNKAIKQLTDSGVHVVVAAGNENADACNTSPASELSAMTVGASSNTYQMASFSNWGKCVDVLAPGTKITSTLPGGKIGDLQGTSMASPAQAGVYALILSENRTFTPATMKKVVSMTCTKNLISNVKQDTPNCFINSLV